MIDGKKLKQKAIKSGLMDEKTFNRNLNTLRNATNRIKDCNHKFILTYEHPKYKYRCEKCGLMSQTY